MSFLTLNGVPWNVSTQQAQPRIVEVGWSGRQIDGSLAGTRRALKREWKLKTIPYSPTDALVFQNTLLGLGHHWSFDDSVNFKYSSKGLFPFNVVGTATYNTASPAPKFGAGCLNLSSGGQILWLAMTGIDGNIAAVWSAAVWFWNGSSWDGYAISHVNSPSTTVCYKNGALLGSTLPQFITFNNFSGIVGLQGKSFTGTNQIAFLDDFVVVPYLARAADLAAWSSATQAFSELPRVTPGGDLITAISPNAPGAVLGSVDAIDEMVVNLGDGGGLYDDAQQISFALREV